MINVLEYLENTAKRLPDKTAVVDDKDSCTYKELENISKGIGYVLSDMVEAGKPVAVMMKKSVVTLQVFMGTAYAGGFYSLLDPDFPVERLKNQLEVLNPAVVVVAEDNLDKLKETGYSGPIMDIEELLSKGKSVDVSDENVSAKLESIRESLPEDTPLYCNFTSGSTGTPKGVLVGHASVIDFIDRFTELFDITEDDVIGNQAPFDFDVSVKDIFSSFKVGAKLVIIPTAFFRFPNGVMDMLEEHKVTTLIWAVSALVLINRLHEFMYKVPPCINKILFSGEEMPVKHLKDWIAQYPDAKFVNLYGPTEITCNCTFYRIDNENIPEKLPIGSIYPGKIVEIYDEEGKLIDEKTEEKVGELCVSGKCLALGYYNNPEATAKAFVERPGSGQDGESAGERMYKTGDLAYWKDGELYFAGRRDFQIKHNGHRLELEEIERALNSLSQVQQACCIYDMEKYRIVAFYTGTNDRKGIVEGLKKRLPEYSLPNVYKYMEELPLSKNGKIDRAVLRQSV